MSNTKGAQSGNTRKFKNTYFSLWSIQSGSSVSEEGNTHAKTSLTRALKVAMRKSP